jgi:hypothetical protein
MSERAIPAPSQPSRHALAGLALLVAGLACGCGAPHAAGRPPPVLPLTTLRLYETGIGYFERSGTLAPSENAGLPVPASHLDDALRSLVVLTPGEGERLRGVRFPSSLSRGMARALAGLTTPAGTPIGYRDLLASLVGTHVEATTRTATFAGRLVDLDTATDAKDTAAPVALLIATDGGEIVRIAAADIRAIRPTDANDLARLDAAIAAQSTRAAQTRKVLEVLASARGPITLGYVTEAPVWRTTYRVVVGRDGRATLQAWALVHNDTDEPWQNVRLELANGRPDSFLFPLAAPRYARRELVHPDDELSTVPQLLDRTVDTLWGDRRDSAGDDGEGESGGGTGEGIGLGGIGSLGHGVGSGGGRGALSGSSTALAVGDLAKIAQATGIEAGALFVYTMPERLALDAHASALVPFLAQPVDAQPIAWVPQVGEPARAAVRFVNSTAQTLPAGTVAFFMDGGFAGETGLERLKPGERRFLQFAADLDVSVDSTPAPGSGTNETTERLTWSAATLHEHYLRTVRATYAFVNRSARPRAVYLGLAIQANARVTGADAVDYDAATSTALAVVSVAPRGRVTREIVTVEGLSRPLQVEHLTAEALARVVASPGLAAADRAVATEALARQKELEETRRVHEAAAAELDAIEKELARLRDDAKALGGERGAPPPPDLARRLLAAEDRYASARKREGALEAEEKTRAGQVPAVLARLAP